MRTYLSHTERYHLVFECLQFLYFYKKNEIHKGFNVLKFFKLVLLKRS